MVKFSKEKLNSPKYNALAILYSSWVYTRIGDYHLKVPGAYPKAALISEQIQDSEVMATVEYYKRSQ